MMSENQRQQPAAGTTEAMHWHSPGCGHVRAKQEAGVDMERVREAFGEWCKREPQIKMTSGFLYYDAFKAGYEAQTARIRDLEAQCERLTAQVELLRRAADPVVLEYMALPLDAVPPDLHRSLSHLARTLINPDAGAARLLVIEKAARRALERYERETAEQERRGHHGFNTRPECAWAMADDLRTALDPAPCPEGGE